MSDLISRQAAIDDIRTMNPKDAKLDIKWVEMWLKQLPSAQPEVAKDTNVPINDTISRQVAIDGLSGHYVERRNLNDWQMGWNNALEWVEDVYLKDLPSVQPEPDWKEIMVICDNCGHAVHAKRENCKVTFAQPEQPEWAQKVERMYNKALCKPYIQKPLAWALYQVWKEYDREK